MKRTRHAATVLFGLMLWQFATPALAQQPTQAQIGAIKQSCRSDYQAHCSSVPPGGSAALQCLQSHVNDLSPGCQSAVNAASGNAAARAGSGAPPASAPPAMASHAPPAMSPREELGLMRRYCGGDFRAYCRGVPLGGGEAMRCLAENQSRLSPPCRNAMAEARAAR